MPSSSKLSGSACYRPLAFAGMLCTFAVPVCAETEWTQPSLSFMGVPGILEMPTAHAMNDADLTITQSFFDRTARTTFHFQIAPRLSGVFRYAYLDGFRDQQYLDRSFDLRYLLMDESPTRPAISVALQDFGGTGIYAGEYIVATKTFGRLRATGGIGWGRFGSYNGFTNPLAVFGDSLKTRPDGNVNNQTGRVDFTQWFRGDAAFFGGLQYVVNDRMRLSMEYSSDAYELEGEEMDFERPSPFNFGVSYRFRNGIDMTGAFLHGNKVAINFAYTYNPKTPNTLPPAQGNAPVPVAVRNAGASADLGWTANARLPAALQDRLATVMAADKLELDGFSVEANRAIVRFRNLEATNPAQAVGRVARIMTNLMPASVEVFDIVNVSRNGLPVSRVRLQRSDLEELEYAVDGAWQSYARAQIEDAVADPAIQALDPIYTPSFQWNIAPYLAASYFDPEAPLRIDLGLEVDARYEPVRSLVFEGRVRQLLAGNRGDLPESNSELPRVRSDVGLYAREGTTALSQLTMAKYFRPGEDLYGRVTTGYLETMYAGVSAELLWKPINSRLGLGSEINFVKQREYSQGFGFRDYDVVTGHGSAYFQADNGFQYQVDVGRYLAGDWGATLSIDRTFRNGVEIGAFATLTDVPFEEFGEGSFDKGVRFRIPLSALSGQRTTREVTRTIRPVLRDGGARVFVPGRLYDSVRTYHKRDLQDQWGRFWR